MSRTIFLLFTLVIIASLVLTGCSSNNSTSTTTTTTTAISTTSTMTTTVSSSTSTTTSPIKTSPPSTTTRPPVTTPAISTSIPTTTAVKQFTASSPAVKFNADDIAFLGVNFTGSPAEIANAIRKWQEDNMTYVFAVMDYQDVSDPIRWNYFLPGIYTSRDIIHEQVKNGKIYGVCFSYAITYCSIAEYYGLETRVVSSISKPSDTDPSITMTTGMSPQEYDRLKIKLDKLGINYDYEAVRLVAEETPTHYWAEVKLDGKWVIMDGTQKATGNDTQSGFIDKNDFAVVDWASRDKSATLDDYQQNNHGERPPEGGSGEIPGPITTTPKNYVGVTDDLGQTGRAASIDDVMQGKALVPYFNNASDAYTFIKATSISQNDISNSQLLKLAYEMQSGKKMYVAALLICQDKTGAELSTAYKNLCGEELDLQVYNQLKTQYGGQ